MQTNYLSKSTSIVVALLSSAIATILQADVANAIAVTPTSYTYDIAPSGFYPDTGGTELTDGAIATTNWFGTDRPLYSGWQNVEPTITFDFGGIVNIDSLIFSFDDSNGAGAVTTPDSIEISMGGVTLTRNIIDPAGDDPITETFAGLGLTGSTLDLKVFNAQIPGTQEWTMISEVSFDDGVTAAVPFEFSPAMGLFIAGGFFGVAKYRKTKATKQDIQL